MSGGHYYYAYNKISSFVEEMEEDLLDEGRRVLLGEPQRIPDDIQQFMRKLIETGELFSKASKNLEWYMSGDCGEDSLRGCESFKKMTNKASE